MLEPELAARVTGITQTAENDDWLKFTKSGKPVVDLTSAPDYIVDQLDAQADILVHGISCVHEGEEEEMTIDPEYQALEKVAAEEDVSTVITFTPELINSYGVMSNPYNVETTSV